jgi:nucleotide-binding universal stress UspA family protein
MDITPGTIVVGIDGSTSSHQALAWAVDQARAEHRPLTLVSAFGAATPAWPSDAATLPLEYRDALRAEARVALTAARDAVADRAPDLEVHVVLEAADPRSLLLQLSEHASMLVVGSRGRGPVRSLMLGSVGVALTRHASCPVVVIRPSQHGLVRNGIVVGADATPESRAVLEFAFRQASLRDLPLLVLHCFWDVLAAANAAHVIGGDLDYQEERVMLAESLAGMGEKYPDVHVTTELARGVPAEALVSAAENMDLLVVGGHEQRLRDRAVMRSVSVSVVEHATCPVAVVPVRRG